MVMWLNVVILLFNVAHNKRTELAEHRWSREPSADYIQNKTVQITIDRVIRDKRQSKKYSGVAQLMCENVYSCKRDVNKTCKVTSLNAVFLRQNNKN